MKKKITALCLCVALLAIAVVGASLAYFTDTDNAKNTFTVGNVKIDLIKQEKTDNGLAPFEQGKTLVPGKSNDGNAVSKIVTVKNTGDNAAWVWVELRIPKYLVSNEYPTNESKNALHWNSYGCFNVEYNSGNYWKLATSDGIVDADHKVTNQNMVAVEDGLWNDYKFVGYETDPTTNIEYVVIRTTMQKPLPADKISLPCLAQVYMDWRIDVDGENFILPDGRTIPTSASWEILVNAYAIQIDGFDTVEQAISGYANNGK